MTAKPILLVIAALTMGVTFASASPVLASSDHGSHGKASNAAAATPELTDGEIRKVDAEAMKVTIRHAEIKALEMPAMTMVFRIKDKALLDGIKPGSKVKFRAISDGGSYVVTELKTAN
jgi:Cu(I)/Ag(I) efflux system periplasmic protein CusF